MQKDSSITREGVKTSYDISIQPPNPTHICTSSDFFLFIFGTACQIYCYGRYCVRRSVSPQVPENPSGPLVDNFIVLPILDLARLPQATVTRMPRLESWEITEK